MRTHVGIPMLLLPAVVDMSLSTSLSSPLFHLPSLSPPSQLLSLSPSLSRSRTLNLPPLSRTTCRQTYPVDVQLFIYFAFYFILYVILHPPPNISWAFSKSLSSILRCSDTWFFFLRAHTDASRGYAWEDMRCRVVTVHLYIIVSFMCTYVLVCIWL